MKPFLSILEDNSGLLEDMSRKMDVSLSDHIKAAPEMGGRAFRTAVLRCTACANKSACRETMGSTGTLACAPSFCRNAELLDQWKQDAA